MLCDNGQENSHNSITPLFSGVASRPHFRTLRRVADGVPQPDNRIRLSAFLTLDDIELNIIALFQRFVPVQLNRGVVDEYIRPVFTADESVALGVVEPLDFPFILSHRVCLSLLPLEPGGQRKRTPIFIKTQFSGLRSKLSLSNVNKCKMGRRVCADPLWKLLIRWIIDGFTLAFLPSCGRIKGQHTVFCRQELRLYRSF